MTIYLIYISFLFLNVTNSIIFIYYDDVSSIDIINNTVTLLKDSLSIQIH